jgi:alkylhydroperoxidase family enzyme
MTVSFRLLAVGLVSFLKPSLALAAGERPGSNIQIREQQILGAPPRIAPMTGYSDELRMLATPPEPFPQVVPDMLATIMHNPELLRRFTPMMRYFLVDSTLPLRDRELAILRNAWLMKAPYEWGEHVKIARDRGFTAADIERITKGANDPGWSDHERAVLRATEELHHDVMISDETWGTLAKTFNEAQLVEFPLLLGQYRAVANLQNSLRMTLRKGFKGLSSR